ncbi:MAG: LysR family transcriptional regulator, partial [Coprobacillus sp.]|nr:LysR family transcriptional regulator [Coprobacillus sp.]
MEFRLLQYFLAIAREETILKAAESLNVTQPTLSRQMKELEDHLGKQLFIRGNRKITLTEEGILLRQRAEEIVSLVEKTESEIMLFDETLSGEVCIGSGETLGIEIICKAIQRVQEDYPHIKFHLFSGNEQDVTDRLEKGLIDFGMIIEPANIYKYNHLSLPYQDL